jgi:ABC-type spermidine/putrescine transport system permease subunit I
VTGGHSQGGTSDRAHPAAPGDLALEVDQPSLVDTRATRRGGRSVTAWLAGCALLAPLVVVLGAIFALPLGRVVWVALSQPSLGFENFRTFFSSESSRRAFVTTLETSAVVTLLALAIGVFVAWQLSETRSRGKRLILWSAVLFPLWTGLIVRNYAFTILLQRDGVLNNVLRDLHLIDSPLSLLYTKSAVVIGMLYTMLPYAIFPLYAGFVSIDRDLIRAAETLGASRPRALASVVVPLALPTLLAAGAIVFVVSVGFYVTPILLGGPTSPFVATTIDRRLFTLFDFPGAAAAGTVLFVAALAIIGAAWRAVGFERIQRAVA